MKTYIALFFIALTVLQCSTAPASDSVEPKESDKDNSSVEKKPVCEPGTRLRKECNSCFCAKDGSGFACTKMACPPDVYNEDGSLKPQSPAVEALAVEDASDSVVIEAKDNAIVETTEAVTQITEAVTETTEATSEVTSEDLKAIPKIPWGPLYVAGTPCPDKMFYSECNQCFCGKDGISAGCTLMLCDGFRSIYEKQSKDATVVA